MATYRLRDEIYNREYHWVNNNAAEYERDGYDDFSTHYIARSPIGETVGTVRTISHEFEWMAESGFDGRFRDSARLMKGEGTNEASRLAVSKRYRNAYITNGITVLDLMLSKLLLHNLLEGIDYTHIITFAAMGKLLDRRGLRIGPVSEVKVLPDNCQLQAFIVSTRHSVESYRPYQALIGSD